MKIKFESPSGLARVEYKIHIVPDLFKVKIIGVQVYTRPYPQHKYTLSYRRRIYLPKTTNNLYLITTKCHLALAELPFDENGPTPEIKSKILKALKQQLTIS